MTQYKSDLLRRLHILECEIPSLKKILENKEKQLKLWLNILLEVLVNTLELLKN